jgi:hypothetical protein
LTFVFLVVSQCARSKLIRSIWPVNWQSDIQST